MPKVIANKQFKVLLDQLNKDLAKLHKQCIKKTQPKKDWWRA